MNARSPLAALLAAVLLASPVAAQAPKGGGGKAASDEARTRYERGLQLFDEGAYEPALIEFQRAYELSPTYKILYNIAKVNRQINDYAASLRAYERYLNEGAREITAARKAEVDKEIGQLKARVATLQITANAPDAEITIDDVSVGKAPLSIIVNAGRRKVGGARAGRVPGSKTVTVAGADTLKVELDLPEASGAVAPVATPPATTTTPPPARTDQPPPPAASATPTDPTSDSKSFPTVGWVATGVFAVGATVTGVLALSASSSLKSDRDSATASRGSLDDDHSKQRTFALVSDILTGATIVVGGVSLYMTLKSGKSDSTAGVRRLDVGVQPGGVRFLGSF